MNARADPEKSRANFWEAADNGPHRTQGFMAGHKKEDRCPARRTCDYIRKGMGKKKKTQVDSIWEDVYHTGRVALVRLRDWAGGVLIRT